jgi:hypothetical protein
MLLLRKPRAGRKVNSFEGFISVSKCDEGTKEHQQSMNLVLTLPQRRALRAAERGEVKRRYDGEADTLTAPYSGAKALRNILKRGLITDGPRQGDSVTMTLTVSGVAALNGS